ncbi:short chain dehydrogenase [Arenibacter nanhaiticus]|uniref:Short chain dehydrogenase n=1 Tax=Arenibacter nanhaiticus TaxID=558155 RepID=A0A1M6AM11_9FLAO|nr:SDR family NAD(P)-dependent oxidoreductase [Arenibacter nanhaiticus]SHI37447.1 short chain dehydrogenase [Arenibacter nanhaiticus]
MNTSKFFDLNGETAIVTCGGNGIGKASCKILAAYGAQVVVSDFNMEAAQQAAQEIVAEDGKAIAIDCDAPKDEAPANLVDKTIAA